MKYCENCKVNVRGVNKICPLCQSKLTGHSDEVMYPEIKSVFKQYELFFKLLVLGTVSGGVASVAVNIILPKSGFWSFFVVLGIVCFWISLYYGFKKRHNLPRNISNQVLLVSGLCVVWDLITGWHGWSLDYVFPCACAFSIISLVIVAKIFKLPPGDYQMCLTVDIIFGAVPVVFYVTGLANIAIPSVICTAISIISFVFILLFNGKEIKEEIIKRFHI